MIRSIHPNEVHKTLASPTYFTLPPEVRHVERIPAEVIRLQTAWQQRWFPPRAIRLCVLEDVYVTGEGLVFTDTLDVVDMTIREHKPIDIELGRLSIIRERAALDQARRPGTFLLCRKPGTRNYGH